MYRARAKIVERLYGEIVCVGEEAGILRYSEKRKEQVSCVVVRVRGERARDVCSRLIPYHSQREIRFKETLSPGRL